MAADLLSRTILFAQTAVRWPEDPPEEVVRDALTTSPLRLTVSPEATARADAQQAALTFVNLVARYGCPISLDVPPAPAAIRHPLIPVGATVDAALRALVREINPGVPVGGEPAFDVMIGSGEPGEDKLIIGWTAWSGGASAAARMPDADLGPVFGPMVGAHLAALEVFKAVLREIGRRLGLSSTAFNRDTMPAELAFSLLTYERECDDRGRALPAVAVDLTETTFVSAGAMTSAALFGLVGAVPIVGAGRVLDPGVLDPPDVNRYAFAYAQDDGSAKAPLLAERLSGFASLRPVSERYEDVPREERCTRIAVVGVDHVPSRAAVQRDWPDLLLCGATQGPEVIVSRHGTRGDTACCECIHPPEGQELPPEVPTLSAVSGLAGLVLAAELVKENTTSLAAYRLAGRLHMRPLQLQRQLNVEVSRPEPRRGCSCGRAPFT